MIVEIQNFKKLEKFPDYNKLLITKQTTLIYRLEIDYKDF